MLFHKFNSQNERKEYGGSNFVEMQFCKLQPLTSVKEIVAVDNIEDWKDDSLYIDDENAFYEIYGHIFSAGVYNNLQTGTVDLYGVNYYNPVLTERIIKQIALEKPSDYEALLAWLEEARFYNGFYILGI